MLGFLLGFFVATVLCGTAAITAMFVAKTHHRRRMLQTLFAEIHTYTNNHTTPPGD